MAARYNVAPLTSQGPGALIRQALSLTDAFQTIFRSGAGQYTITMEFGLDADAIVAGCIVTYDPTASRPADQVRTLASREAWPLLLDPSSNRPN